jgi:hypothetical protein
VKVKLLFLLLATFAMFSCEGFEPPPLDLPSKGCNLYSCLKACENWYVDTSSPAICSGRCKDRCWFSCEQLDDTGGALL